MLPRGLNAIAVFQALCSVPGGTCGFSLVGWWGVWLLRHTERSSTCVQQLWEQWADSELGELKWAKHGTVSILCIIFLPKLAGCGGFDTASGFNSELLPSVQIEGSLKGRSSSPLTAHLHGHRVAARVTMVLVVRCEAYVLWVPGRWNLNYVLGETRTSWPISPFFFVVMFSCVASKAVSYCLPEQSSKQRE